MVLFLEIMAILFMFSLMFVAIWGFITINQILGQMKYKNYLLEKLTQNVYMLAAKGSMDVKSSFETAVSEFNNEGKESK